LDFLSNCIEISPNWCDFHQIGEIFNQVAKISHQIGALLHQNGASFHQFWSNFHQNGASSHQNGASFHQIGAIAHQNGTIVHQNGAVFYQKEKRLLFFEFFIGCFLKFIGATARARRAEGCFFQNKSKIAEGREPMSTAAFPVCRAFQRPGKQGTSRKSLPAAVSQLNYG
jgi:hypothetical protein